MVDRSWARSARNGSVSRKRPDLLSVDFGAERERAPSPTINENNTPYPNNTSLSSSQSAIVINAAHEKPKPRYALYALNLTSDIF